MIFPIEQLVKYKDNIYEITVAANRRAYQMSMMQDPQIEENEDKVVSLAASQLFNHKVSMRLDQK